MKFLQKKRGGSAHFIVIAALVLISVFSAYTIHMLRADIFQIHANALQMQAYYLADEAASASVSALLADDDASLLKTGTFPMTDRMTHTFSGKVVGESQITMSRETHSYYDEETEWIVIRVNTTMKDNRSERKDEDFTYSMTVMVLSENPLVQLYNIDPDKI